MTKSSPMLCSDTFTWDSVPSLFYRLKRNLLMIWKEYDYKIQKWFSQYDGKPYEHPIPWKRFQNASPLYPVLNDVVLYFEMSPYINNDITRCPKCVLFEYPPNITRQISAKLVDSDECQKAKTVNTSSCNEARFWCKEIVELAYLGSRFCSVLTSSRTRIITPGPGPVMVTFNHIKVNGSHVLHNQTKSYPDAVRTCQDQNSSLTAPKNTNAFYDFAISRPGNQFWSPIKRLNVTHYQAQFQQFYI